MLEISRKKLEIGHDFDKMFEISTKNFEIWAKMFGYFEQNVGDF